MAWGKEKVETEGEGLEEQLVPFCPISFFQLSFDVREIDSFPSSGFPDLPATPRYLIPDTHQLCNEAHFAKVYMGWHQKGLAFKVIVKKTVQKVAYPDVSSGDSVELFIDTRDVKTAGFNTRFCHHFFFLPEAVEGQQAGEITHFRTDDTHPLCDCNDLKVKSQQKSGEYTLQIFIPNSCLYGYDVGQFDRLGFTYRINRPGGEGKAQHFSVVSEEYQVDQQPSLWSSLKLSA